MESTDKTQTDSSKAASTTIETDNLTSPSSSPNGIVGRLKHLAAYDLNRRESAIHALKTAGSVLMYAVLLLLVFVAYGSIPNRWYKVITIEGSSMAPTLHYGDLIVITPPPTGVEVGTIVTLQVDQTIVTHRFIGYDDNGRRVFKGDANEQPDDYSDTSYHIIGVYQFKIPLLGHINIQANKALQAMRQSQGANRDGS